MSHRLTERPPKNWLHATPVPLLSAYEKTVIDCLFFLRKESNTPRGNSPLLQMSL